MSSGKGEIEVKLDNFVKKSYDRFGLNNDQCMNRQNAAILMKELMVQHGHGDAWDPKEFNHVFDLFEEDDPSNHTASENEGLDRDEFTKLVKRIAQL
eukprot:CAMPEP_0170491250 /NCGR_PEP_ID=MMETSP0208-20121228/10673_1 /TAXON_ID=197538 /ORGANISM="Strombidium inclinatum, Strain S3" /LENGTH=96 /DNA_ID=CAMNT_0010766795 /DNA_START=22 /DNA_END=312 /DNA_ORIENTATION=+